MITQYYNKGSGNRKDVNSASSFYQRHNKNSWIAKSVRPLEKYAAGVIYKNEKEKTSICDTMLFVKYGNRLTSEEVSGVMSAQFLKVLGLQVTLRTYRHIAIAFMNRHIKSNVLNNDKEGNYIGDIQFIHTSKITATKIYNHTLYITRDMLSSY